MNNVRTDETLVKCHQLVQLMERANLEGILLETIPNQTWLVPTLEPYTPLVAESSKILLYIPRSGKMCVAGPDNEIPQILTKDLVGCDVKCYT